MSLIYDNPATLHGCESLYNAVTQETYEDSNCSGGKNCTSHSAYYLKTLVTPKTKNYNEYTKENPTCTEEAKWDVVTYDNITEKEVSRETQTIPALGHSFFYTETTLKNEIEEVSDEELRKMIKGSASSEDDVSEEDVENTVNMFHLFGNKKQNNGAIKTDLPDQSLTYSYNYIIFKSNLKDISDLQNMVANVSYVPTTDIYPDRNYAYALVLLSNISTTENYSFYDMGSDYYSYKLLDTNNNYSIDFSDLIYADGSDDDTTTEATRKIWEKINAWSIEDVTIVIIPMFISKELIGTGTRYIYQEGDYFLTTLNYSEDDERYIESEETYTAETVVTQEPTCTSTGSSYQVCYRCNELVYTTIPVTAHTPKDAVKENVVAATCTSTGSYESVVYCEDCNAEISRTTITTDAISHTSITSVISEATCTIAKMVKDICDVCKTILKDTYSVGEPLGHTPKAAVRENVINATCTQAGSYDSVSYCSVCDNEVSREAKTIAIVEHTPKDAVKENIVAATCTQAGSYDEVVYCKDCNAEISRTTKAIAIKEHNTESVLKVAATCLSPAQYQDICKDCAAVVKTYTVGNALGHTAKDPIQKDVVSPTCTKAGSYKAMVYCKTCGALLSQETVITEALGHDLSEWMPKARDFYPSCVQSTMVRFCSRCDYYEEKLTDLLDHTIGDVVKENIVEATCEENGSYEENTYCSECNNLILSIFVPVDATGHTEKEYMDEAKDGSGVYKIVKCIVCGKELSRVFIPKDSNDTDNNKDNDNIDVAETPIIIKNSYTVVTNANVKSPKTGQ